MEVNTMKQSSKILTEKEMELVSLLMQDCESTGDIQSKLKRLFAGSIEQILEAETGEHLGYDKHSALDIGSGNSRNGYNRKNIISEYGECEIANLKDNRNIANTATAHQRTFNRTEKPRYCAFVCAVAVRDKLPPAIFTQIVLRFIWFFAITHYAPSIALGTN